MALPTDEFVNDELQEVVGTLAKGRMLREYFFDEEWFASVPPLGLFGQELCQEFRFALAWFCHVPQVWTSYKETMALIRTRFQCSEARERLPTMATEVSGRRCLT